MNKSMIATKGYRCKVSNCKKKHNRLFTLEGLRMHLNTCHNKAYRKTQYEWVKRHGQWHEVDTTQKANRLIEKIKQWEAGRSVQANGPGFTVQTP